MQTPKPALQPLNSVPTNSGSLRCLPDLSLQPCNPRMLSTGVQSSPGKTASAAGRSSQTSCSCSRFVFTSGVRGDVLFFVFGVINIAVAVKPYIESGHIKAMLASNSISISIVQRFSAYSIHAISSHLCTFCFCLLQLRVEIVSKGTRA